MTRPRRTAGRLWRPVRRSMTLVHGQRGRRHPHVDGRGTVPVTETVQADETATRAGRETRWRTSWRARSVPSSCGCPRLTRDYRTFGTRDTSTSSPFRRADTILFHDQRKLEHPDHTVSSQVREVLAAAGDCNSSACPRPTSCATRRGLGRSSYITHYVGQRRRILVRLRRSRRRTGGQRSSRRRTRAGGRARGRSDHLLPWWRHPLHHAAAAASGTGKVIAH